MGHVHDKNQLILYVYLFSVDAENKICPMTLKRMPAGMPCTLGSTALFSSEELREKANATFHKYEYRILESWKELGLSAYAKLAYRLVTMIPKDQVSKIAQNLDKKTEDLSEIEQIFNLPVTQPCSADAMTYAYLVYFLVMCLEEHQYFDNKVTQDDVISLLFR